MINRINLAHDRYTERTFIKIEVAIFLLQGARRDYRFSNTDEDDNTLTLPVKMHYNKYCNKVKNYNLIQKQYQKEINNQLIYYYQLIILEY